MDIKRIDLEPFVAEMMPQSYLKYLAGELTVEHPFDANSQVQTIPGPSQEEVGDYLIKSRGLDFIHLAKYHDGKPYVFAVIGDLKTWMERHDTEGMVWTSTGKKVQIPEYLFTTTEKIELFFMSTIRN